MCCACVCVCARARVCARGFTCAVCAKARGLWISPRMILLPDACPWNGFSDSRTHFVCTCIQTHTGAFLQIVVHTWYVHIYRHTLAHTRARTHTLTHTRNRFSVRAVTIPQEAGSELACADRCAVAPGTPFALASVAANLREMLGECSESQKQSKDL